MPEFKFESLADFIEMGGHGIYVWSCTAIALALLSALVIHPLWLKKRQINRLLRQQALVAAQKARHQQMNKPQV